jgi:hypothetical protein
MGNPMMVAETGEEKAAAGDRWSVPRRSASFATKLLPTRGAYGTRVEKLCFHFATTKLVYGL